MISFTITPCGGLFLSSKISSFIFSNSVNVKSYAMVLKYAAWSAALITLLRKALCPRHEVIQCRSVYISSFCPSDLAIRWVDAFVIMPMDYNNHRSYGRVGNIEFSMHSYSEQRWNMGLRWPATAMWDHTTAAAFHRTRRECWSQRDPVDSWNELMAWSLNTTPLNEYLHVRHLSTKYVVIIINQTQKHTS